VGLISNMRPGAVGRAGDRPHAYATTPICVSRLESSIRAGRSPGPEQGGVNRHHFDVIGSAAAAGQLSRRIQSC
jgi:hypothetical protein